MARSSSDKKTIQHQYDALAKKTLKGEAKSYHRELAKHAAREIPFSEMSEAIQFVTQHEAEFVQEAADSSLRERDAEFARKRETLTRAESRIAELDNLFKHLY